jgi:hypothetical protein
MNSTAVQRPEGRPIADTSAPALLVDVSGTRQTVICHTAARGLVSADPGSSAGPSGARPDQDQTHTTTSPEELAMTINRIENVPLTWDDPRDVPFFALTAWLFSPDFTYGAGVLLASYDASVGDESQCSVSAAEHAASAGELVTVSARRGLTA